MPEDPLSTQIDVSLLSKQWLSFNDLIAIKSLFNRAFNCVKQCVGPVQLSGELSVCLTDDQQIQKLNQTYRHKDESTNVLAFPAETELTLGDVVLSYETIMKEAKIQQKTFQNHLLHLFIHGILHLIGYDHKEIEEQTTMETLEINILKQLGVNNPYV